jgi:mannose-1-phosphate guanylyltransferase / phosphomannomutase
MKAVIMAGGEGSRLRPLTCTIPKPMVPVAGKPTMEHIINLLKKHSITDIATTLFYLPEAIMEHFSDGSKFGVNLNYFVEQTPLGTGGSVLNAKEFLDDSFIVISGDALTDIDLEKAMEFHKSKGSKATLILKRTSIPLEYGIVITDIEGQILRFLEKPSWGEVFSDTINTGIYILEPEIFSYYNKGDNFDFSKDLFPRLLKHNVPLYGYIADEYWCDIGDLNTYLQTNFDSLDKKVAISFSFKEKTKGVWVGDNTIISNKASIKGPCYIGRNCIIKSGCKIGPYSIIEDNTIVHENTSIKHSILWASNTIGKNNQIRGSIICSKVATRDNVKFFEGSVIGSYTNVLNSVTVNPNIKIWPSKQISENSIINNNLVWGSRYSGVLFGNKGVSGEINLDITPEFASLLGSTFASVMKKNFPLIISSDGSNMANVIKESLTAGVLSSGTKVISLSDVPIFVSRYAIRFYKSGGGVHISHDKYNNSNISIEFLNNTGGYIDRNTEKKIEHLFSRQDFERSNATELGSNIRVENFSSLYELNNLSHIKSIGKIKSKSPDIIIASMDEKLLTVVSSFLENTGCKVHYDNTLRDYSNLDEFINEFSYRVVNNSYFMGSIIAPDGDGIILIDHKGRIIDKDKYTVLSSLVALKQSIGTLVVPHTSTLIVDELARSFKAKVKRTKASNSDFINELLRSDSDSDSFLQYLLNFDPALALAKIIELLVTDSISLSDFADELPEYYICKDQIRCSFEERGRIIRQIIDENKNNSLELFEGIRLNSEKGWTLVLPDNNRPILNIFVEGYCQEYAEELTAQIKDRLNTLINKN